MIKELSETVELMLSKDYKERFRAEYYQLRIRYQKLKNLLDKWNNDELDFEPSCPKGLLMWQLHDMESYLHHLGERAKYEGINFELEENEIFKCIANSILFGGKKK